MSLLFLNGLLLDGLGGVVERGGVLVEGARIVAVGTGLDKHADADTRVVDLQGMSLLPGLVDTHVHIAGGDYLPGHEQESLGMAAFRSAEAARRTLWAGITTIRTAGSRDFLDVDLRDAINAGIIAGPRLVASGRGITTTGGHLHEVCMEVDGVDAVVRAVRYHTKRRVDSMKIMLSAGVSTAGSNVQIAQFSLEETCAAVAEAHKHGMKVLTHSIGYEAIQNGVQAGVDSIDHGYWLDEELAVSMRNRGIYLVPTFGPFHYYTVVREAEPWRIARAELVAPRLPAVLQLALEVGVPIAMGSDCGAPSRYPNGQNALELELMVNAGMKPEQALKAGTSEAAKLIGLSAEIGSLEPGKYADLMVVDGNPLDDMGVLRTSVKLVMKEGQICRNQLDARRPSPDRISPPDDGDEARDM